MNVKEKLVFIIKRKNEGHNSCYLWQCGICSFLALKLLVQLNWIEWCGCQCDWSCFKWRTDSSYRNAKQSAQLLTRVNNSVATGDSSVWELLCLAFLEIDFLFLISPTHMCLKKMQGCIPYPLKITDLEYCQSQQLFHLFILYPYLQAF